MTVKSETKSSIEVPNAQQQVAVAEKKTSALSSPTTAQNDKFVQNGDDQVINFIYILIA